MPSNCLLLLLLLAVPRVRALGAERMGIWVPLYVEPSDEYENLIRSVETDKCLRDSFHGTVLTGPRSGPPDSRVAEENARFRERFAVVANTKQWTAFGYVTTLYARRDLKDVLADIKMWLDPEPSGYGDQVQGIWVDNVKSDTRNEAWTPEDLEYYNAVVNLIKSYGKLVALNPGQDFKRCDFLDGRVDFLNNFEDPYQKWLEMPKGNDGDCPCKSQTRCIASIHAFPAASAGQDIAKAMRLMSARGYRAMFVTDREMPGHYSKLPTFFPEVINGACQTVIEQGKRDDAGQDAAAATEGDKAAAEKAAAEAAAKSEAAAAEAAAAKAASDAAAAKQEQAAAEGNAADDAAAAEAAAAAARKRAAEAAAAEEARKAAEQAALDARKAAEAADAEAKAAAEAAAADAAKQAAADGAAKKAEEEKAAAQAAADALAAAVKAEAEAKSRAEAQAKAAAEAEAKAKAVAEAQAAADAAAKAAAEAAAKAAAEAAAKAAADAAAKAAATKAGVRRMLR